MTQNDENDSNDMVESNATNEGNEGDKELGPTADQISDLADDFATAETNGASGSRDPGRAPRPGDPDFRIRDEWNGRTIYLPDGVVNDVDLLYQELNLKYQREYQKKLPKNELFYPAIFQAALNDPQTVREILNLEGKTS